MAQQTRTQKFAGKAFTQVKKVVESGDDKLRKEYKSRADSFPVMVLQSGLAQAIGFLHAKSKNERAYATYLADLASVLGHADAKALHRKVLDASLPEYRHLSHEVLEVAALIKRFGQTELTDKS